MSDGDCNEPTNTRLSRVLMSRTETQRSSSPVVRSLVMDGINDAARRVCWTSLVDCRAAVDLKKARPSHMVK